MVFQVRLDKRTTYVILFILIDLILSIFIISLPHDLGNRKGTIPDEWAYYAWADMYLQGRWAIPIQDLAIVAEGGTVIVPEVEPLTLSVIFIDADNGGMNNDLYVKVTFSNGSATPQAKVFIPTINAKEVCDSEGICIFYNLTIEHVEVVAKFSVDGKNYIGTAMVDHAISPIKNYMVYIHAEYQIISIIPFRNNSEHEVALLAMDRFIVSDTEYRVYINGEFLCSLKIDEPVRCIIPAKPPFTIKVINEKGHGFSNGFISIDGVPLPLDLDGKGEFLGLATVDLEVIIEDILGHCIEDAKIFVDGSPIGKTNANGRYSIRMPMALGYHRIRAEKSGIEPRNLFSVVTKVGDNYYLVSHWPPGHSILIGLFKYVGMEAFISFFMLVMGSWAVFRIGEMYHNAKAGFIAAILWSFTGGTIMMMFSRYMGDLSTTSFAIFGFYLFLMCLEDCRSRDYHPLLSLIGGVFMAFAIVIRYSTAVVMIAPFIMGCTTIMGCINIKQKKIDKETFKRILKGILPFAIGFIIVLVMLFHYNTTYFGGPLNSGYQMDTKINIVSIEGGGANATSNVPTESFFESYFRFDETDINNIPRQLSLIYFIHPPLLMMFAALFIKRRKSILMISMLAWSLAIMVIYFSQGWAGSWIGNEARSMEDMRYYLPALPTSVILVATLLTKATETKDVWDTNINTSAQPKITSLKTGKKRYMAVVSVCVIVLLSISGLAVGIYAIDKQIHRGDIGMGGGRPLPGEKPLPEEQYMDTTIGAILAEPTRFESKPVHVRNVTISNIITENMIVIERVGKWMYLHIEENADVNGTPKIGCMVEAWGHIRRGFDNPEGDSKGSWEINIRARPSQDRVIFSKVQRVRGPSKIRIIVPENDKPLPPKEIVFVARVSEAEHDTVVIFRLNGGNDIEGKRKPGTQDFIVVYDLRPWQGTEITVEAIALNKGDIIGRDTRHYTVMEEVGNVPLNQKTKHKGKMTGNELFFPQGLVPVFLMLLIAFILTYALGIYISYKAFSELISRRKDVYIRL